MSKIEALEVLRAMFKRIRLMIIKLRKYNKIGDCQEWFF